MTSSVVRLDVNPHSPQASSVNSYRVKIPTLWHQASQGLLLGAVAARLSQWLQGAPFSWPDTLPFMGFTAVAVTIVYFFQPTKCGPQGLMAMTPWGVRRHVAWDQIKEVTFGRLYLLQPSLKLIDAQGRTFWISRDTKDLRGLHTDSMKFGGPLHPLTVALQTPLFEL